MIRFFSIHSVDSSSGEDPIVILGSDFHTDKVDDIYSILNFVSSCGHLIGHSVTHSTFLLVGL